MYFLNILKPKARTEPTARSPQPEPRAHTILVNFSEFISRTAKIEVKNAAEDALGVDGVRVLGHRVPHELP